MSEYLRLKIKECLEKAEKQGFKRTPLLLSAAIEPGNFRTMLIGVRPFSDSMLERFASIPDIGVTHEELRALRDIDERGEDFAYQIAQETIRIIQEERESNKN